MTKYRTQRWCHLTAASVVALTLCAGQAHAQTQPDENASSSGDAAASDQEDIVVTGSRIARRDYISNSPISTIGQSELERTGSVTPDTALVQMPQFTASTGSSTNSNANGGQANIQLRGLGRQRTLVLMDGRRLPPANADGSVDVNMIPAALIENIEVITGGASAVYGSDAVAGVVNFKLRRSIDGIEIGAQAGISDKNDAADQRVSIAAGTDFADGRGNIMIAGEYANRDAVLVSERGYTFGASRDSISPFGTVGFAANNRPSQAALNTVFGRYGIAPGTVSPVNSIGFNPDGTLYSSGVVVANYRGSNDPDIAVSNGATIGYDGRRFRYLQLPLERYSAFARARFEASEALTLTLQGLYTRTDTGIQLNPAPVPGSRGISAVPVTNPFIPPEFRELLASRPNPTATFNVDLRPDAIGPRRRDFSYETYQLLAGAEGKLGLGDWSYAVSATYGRNQIDELATNYVSLSRLNAVTRAADGGASLCAGGYNFFGNAPVSDSCRRFLSPDLNGSTRLTQTIVEASFQGGLFELPGGSVRAAFGADYRKDEYAVRADPLVVAGDILAAAGQVFDGQIDVSEVFAELSLPILADMPFFHALNLDLGYRYSDYSNIGGVHTYKADGYWEPVKGVRFRGGYERAIRAPNIGENFQPQALGGTIIGLAGSLGSGDPCDINGAYRLGANAANVRALCLAQGVPAGLIDSYSYGQQTVVTISGGNPDLKQETADTFSAGFVLAPDLSSSLLRRFTLSADIYWIDVADAVGSITTNISLARCFNADGISNPTYAADNVFCSLIPRESGTGQIYEARELLFNLGGYKTSGIDVQANWETELGDRAGSLTFNLVGSYLRNFKIQSLPSDRFLNYAGTIGNGQIDPVAISRPRVKGLATVTYRLDGFRGGLTWRYIGKMRNAANVGTNGTAAGVNAMNYFDLNLGYEVTPRFDVWATVSNLTDRTPPAYPSAGSSDFATYDAIGRKFTIGVRTRF